jgi:zinc finger SWIM domain-containing protein 3
LVAYEQQGLIEDMVSSFTSRFDEATVAKTQVILTDKDFNEHAVLSKCFPQASLHLCLFHVLRSFGREVTTLKMHISTIQRDTALSLLGRLTHSRSKEEYEKNFQALKDANLPMVYDYIERNWHAERKQWVEGLKAECLSLTETTTNRLESFNKNTKSVVPKLSALPAFFSNFFKIIDTYRDEREGRVATMLDVAINCPDPIERQYRQYLTKYAWQQMAPQFSKFASLEVTSDADFTTYTVG